MPWSLCRWIWQIGSPLYVGTSPAGALNRTRLCIPARALWGAITAELARRRHRANFPGYEQAGKDLEQNARFSYLFPAEQVNGEWKAWLPTYQEGEGLVWQREDLEARMILNDRVFRMRLLITRPGTALRPESDTAEEGTLREFELVSPFWRDEVATAKPVAMTGYLFYKDESQDLREEIAGVDELFVGGDTRYGLGRLRRLLIQPASDFFAGARIYLNGEEPEVETSLLLAHTEAEKEQPIAGALELVSGWDTLRGDLRKGKLTWAPGSRAEEKIHCVIAEDGLWRIH